MKWTTLAAAILVGTCSVGSAEEVPHYSLEELAVDGSRLVPHRSEFADYFLGVDGESTLVGWRYLTVESAHNWGSRDLRLSDVNFSCNGTGVDEVIASAATMAVKSRRTPWALPVGVILSSHHGREVNVAAAMPDGASVRTERDGVERWERDFSKRVDARPSRQLQNNAVLAYTAWPFALALMDLEEGDTFVLADYEHLTDQERYGRVVVGALKTVQGPHGPLPEVREISRFLRPTLEEAQTLDPERSPGRYTRYWVRTSPPYYVGHENILRDEAGRETPQRRLELTGFTSLSVASNSRMRELLEVRRKLREESPHEFWFVQEAEGTQP